MSRQNVQPTGKASQGLGTLASSCASLIDIRRYDCSAADGFCEFREKGVCVFLGDAVDEARAKLGDLAANVGLDVVDEARAAILGRFQANGGPALGEAG